MDELRDPRLDRVLRARAGVDTIDTGAAHDRVLRRASTIRRRRAMASGVAALVLIVGGSALWLRGGDDAIETVPATDATIATTAPSPTAVTSTPVTATDPTTDRGVASTSTAPATPTTTTISTGVGQTGTTTETDGAQVPPPTVPRPTTAAPPPATETRTFTSSGGSITVRSDGAGLTLVSVNPAPGYAEEIEDQRADRVRVRFRTATDSWRIEVRIENGQMVDIISN